MAETTVKAKPDTIVMIHGLWLTPRSWEHWKERYEARGYTVHAPAWPGFEGEVEALNADPSPMKDLRAETVIDAYEAFINELDGDPILMGHSLGGAITQVLLNRGLGSVGVGVSAATVKGIRDLPWSTLRAAGPALNPFKRGDPVPISEKEFHYAFANTMSEEEAKPLYERYAVPAASDVLADIALANLHRNPPTEVDFAKQGRIPLLFIGLAEEGDDAQRAEVRRFRIDHRIPRVRGSAALPGCSWLGRGRGLRDRLGRATRRANGGGACCGEGSRHRGMTRAGFA